ncbi:MAG: translation initiation factor IF-2 [Halieaceae bacterium]|nr:translation initiation factor IF-2 [Halieaceae bacterium]
MAEVTVQQLAKTVGASEERLLLQMKEAGLPHVGTDQVVSDEDKKILLSYLKRSHGESSAAPKKITLKRKTLSTLKTGGTSGKKTVNIEIRKKRTYVKRDQVEEEKQELLKKDDEKIEKDTNLVNSSPSNETDPEWLRQKAAEKRREEDEAREAAVKEAALAAELIEQEKQQAASEKLKERDGKKSKRTQTPANDRDSDRRKTKNKAVDRTGINARGKQRGHNLSLSDLEAAETGVFRRRAGRKKQKPASTHEEHSKHGFEMPTEKKTYDVEVGETISVSSLAQQMSVKSGEVIKELIKLGVMATINQLVDQDTATLVVEEMGHRVKFVSTDAVEESLEETLSLHEGTPEPRAPVVTVMGHVDHGKTSLLDYIRKSSVASGEAGGITQHIGAYHVKTDKGMISFLDTPGHAAFTAIRARGAKSTDIVILVVGADDGVMPQTEEAIQHARAAEVPLIVAVNKIDKEGADPEKVKNELAAKDVIPEDWGGDTQFVNVSAVSGEGVSELLDSILLQAELLELTASSDVPAQGIVIESRLDKGRGPVASLLVQSGTLKQGDVVLAGLHFGRVRAMLDENANSIVSAGPSIPSEILGLNGMPSAGDSFAVVENEKRAREVADFRQERTRDSKLERQQASKIDNMFESMTAVDKKNLNVVLKADVRGSLEAIQSALADLGNQEVKVNLVSGGVGGIAETDITLSMTCNAMILGFNVRADSSAKQLVETEGLDLRYYNVIYDLIDDIKKALSGMLSPEVREQIVGIAEVRDIFRSPKFGQIAGCMVTEGVVFRSKPIRVLRDNIVIYEGELESLRRFKDDANEVRNGTECGIGVKNYTDVKVGDLIEVYEINEIARTL